MAAKSVLKSSVSVVFAFALGTALLAPGTAAAQERDHRGPARMERIERSAPPAMPRAMPSVSQAPSWQSRGPAANPQPAWNGRPAWSNGGAVASQMPQPSRVPGNPGGWNGRPAWSGGGDRERGDRGNGAYPAGQPTFGGPTWSRGSQAPQGNTTPSWGSRNPTYVDPSRGRPRWIGVPGGRGNDGQGNGGGRPGDTVDHTNDHGASWSKDRQGRWYRDTGWQWRQDGRGQWYRDHGDNWGRNNNGQWYRNGWGANTSRDGRRGGGGWNNNGWGYNNGYSNGYSQGYNNGARAWDREGWRRDNRYDWYGWRNRHRNVFSLGFYYAPWQDYSYSRLSIGVVLGEPFYAERYWIADPYAYRLPPAYGPYRWVRYYDDALLVDIYTGEVVDAIYDIFY
jgi:Nickel/cobalt transporter regulator